MRRLPIYETRLDFAREGRAIAPVLLLAFTDDYLIAKIPEEQISVLVINKVLSFPFSVQSDSVAQVAASVEGLRLPIGSGDHGGNCEFLL